MKNNLPKITVITVVFNGAKTLEKTILSLINQAYENIEYIIIDGGSTDGTLDVISRYADSIHFWISESDSGIYDAMNKGIGFSSGESLIFMNAGDVFISAASVQILVSEMIQNKADVVFGSWLRSPENSECHPDYLKGLFNHQSIIYRASLHSTHGKYVNSKKFTTADYAFFMRLISDPNVRKSEFDQLISEVDTTGVSSGLQTFSQKSAVDYLYGKISKKRLLIYLVFHPLYHHIKKAIKWIN